MKRLVLVVLVGAAGCGATPSATPADSGVDIPEPPANLQLTTQLVELCTLAPSTNVESLLIQMENFRDAGLRKFNAFSECSVPCATDRPDIAGDCVVCCDELVDLVYGDVEVYPANTTAFSATCTLMSDIDVETVLSVIGDGKELGVDKATMLTSLFDECLADFDELGLLESTGNTVCSSCMVALVNEVYE